MSILKLKNVGDTYTGHVTKCEAVAGQFGEQVLFQFANNDMLYLPKDSADRQLMRCSFGDGEGIKYEEVEGNTLTFSRDPNKKPGSAPYWSVQLASGAENHPPVSRRAAAGLPANSREAAPPPTDADFEGLMDDGPDASDVLEGTSFPFGENKPVEAKQGGKDALRAANWEAIERAYKWAWDVALMAQTATAEEAGLTPTAESVQAGAATLLIQAEKMNAIR